MHTQAPQVVARTAPPAMERKLQISLTVMVALGCALFGLAQGTAGLAGAAVVAAFFSLYVTDLRKAFRLNRMVANLVAVAASVVVLLDFFASSNRSQLVAIANLLICLQVVLLFQEKTPRTYGYLAVLSLLQVVLAASLPVQLEFGILLTVYIAAAVNFLAMLFVCRTFWPASPPKATTSSSTLMIALGGVHLLATLVLRSTLDAEPPDVLQIAWLLLALFYLVQLVPVCWQPRENRRRQFAVLICTGLLQTVLTVALVADVYVGGSLYLLLLAVLLVVRFRFPGLLVGRQIEPSTAVGESPAARSAVSIRPLAELFRTPPNAAFLYDEKRMTRSLMGFRLLRQLAGLWLASLVFAAVLFMSVPRARVADRTYSEDETVVAMPEGEVSLNEMVDIIDTHDPIFQVKFVDDRTGQPYRINSELYLRGAVFQIYRADDAVWRSFTDQSGSPSRRSLRTVDNRGLALDYQHMDVVRQRFTFQPVNSASLVSVFPAYMAKGRPRDDEYLRRGIRFDLASKRLTRPSREQAAISAYRYEICTTGFYNSRQLTVIPHELGSMVPLDDPADELFDTDLKQIKHTDTVRKNFPHITRLADGVAAALPPDSGHIELARALQHHFLFSSEYTYTLEFSSVKRTPGMNPIEDFVANHHSGHCEYFASALVLALRSQGIPARLVVGYRGGEYNSLGDFYQFHTSDAHAWVEAYLTREEAAGLMSPGQEAVYGAWLRLDPTPSFDDQSSVDRSALAAKANEVYGYARLIWGDYIVNMNSRRQDTIFAPGALTAETLFGNSNLERWNFNGRPTAQQQALILLALVALILFVGLSIFLWRVWRRLRSGRRRDGKGTLPRNQRSLPEPVPFYQRLVAALKRHGLDRSSGQTPREFACVVGGELSESLALREVAAVPRHVVEAFYRVRFGKQRLPSRELAEIEQSLDRLDAALADAKQTHAKPTHLKQTRASQPHAVQTDHSSPDHRQRGNGRAPDSAS